MHSISNAKVDINNFLHPLANFSSIHSWTNNKLIYAWETFPFSIHKNIRKTERAESYEKNRKMPLILSLSHIVNEQQQNQHLKKKCGKDFRGVKKSLNTNLLFICLYNAQWGILDSFSFPHTPTTAVYCCCCCNENENQFQISSTMI